MTQSPVGIQSRNQTVLSVLMGRASIHSMLAIRLMRNLGWILLISQCKLKASDSQSRLLPFSNQLLRPSLLRTVTGTSDLMQPLISRHEFSCLLYRQIFNSLLVVFRRFISTQTPTPSISAPIQGSCRSGFCWQLGKAESIMLCEIWQLGSG